MTLSNFVYIFAAEGPHISLKPEEVLKVGDIVVTNAMIYGVLVAITTILVAVYAARKVRIKPMAGIAQFYEIFIEFMFSMLEQVFNNRAKAVKYAPIFGVFFLFIVFSNLSGILPLVGEGITVNKDTPVFRPFTADLNATLAMSVIAILTVQYYSIKESGFLGHLKHYFTDKPWNPINFFIGILEVFGELTRILSLSLRLFLNTAVGEILIAVFIFVGGFGAPVSVLPIIIFEILVALIQAYVFTVLSATYLGLAIAHSHDHDEHTEDDHSTTDGSNADAVPAGAVSETN